jgi:dynein heavy chain
VQREVEEMLSVLVVVAKQLAKVPGSKRVADLVKVKLEQFRALLPLLHCICNPGLCERHWQQVL